MRATVLALTMLLAATPVLARADPAATDTGVVTTANANDTDLSRWLDDAPPVSQSSYSPGHVLTLGDDRRVHGEMGVGFGTSGYFDAYGAVSVPVGQTGRLGLAYDDAQINRPWRAHQRSLAVDLSVGGNSASADCGTTVHVDGRDVAPLWVANFKPADEALADVDPRCTPQPEARR